MEYSLTNIHLLNDHDLVIIRVSSSHYIAQVLVSSRTLTNFHPLVDHGHVIEHDAGLNPAITSHQVNLGQGNQNRNPDRNSNQTYRYEYCLFKIV